MTPIRVGNVQTTSSVSGLVERPNTSLTRGAYTQEPRACLLLSGFEGSGCYSFLHRLVPVGEKVILITLLLTPHVLQI